MTKSSKNNVIIGVVSILLLLFLYSVRSILLPFFLGIIIAYFLNNTTGRLEKIFKSRKISTIFLITIFTTIVSLLFIFIVPTAIAQTFNLAKDLLTYINNNSELISQKIKETMEYLNINDNESFNTYIKNYTATANKYVITFFNNILSTSVAFINLMTLLTITPITAYYFLNDWNVMMRKIRLFIPPKNKDKVLELFKNIDTVLHACIKEQLNVCLILGLFYGTLLKFSGLKYGFLIGFLTGAFSFIPYIGMVFGFVIAMFMGLYQFGLDFSSLLIISAIFVSGQVLESNFLTPNMVGNKINLHPLWIIFALFCGGTLFGLKGMLFALPVASVMGVLIRFFIKEKIKYIKNEK